MRLSWIFMGLMCVIMAVTTVRGVPILNRDKLDVVARGVDSEDTANEIKQKSEVYHEDALKFFEKLKKDNKRFLSPFLITMKIQEWAFQQWKETGMADPKANQAYKEDLYEQVDTLEYLQNDYEKPSVSQQFDGPKVSLIGVGVHAYTPLTKSTQSDVHASDEMHSLQLESNSRKTTFYTDKAGSDEDKQEIEEISEELDNKLNEWKETELPGTLQKLYDEADRIIKEPVLPSEKETQNLLDKYQEQEDKYLRQRLLIELSAGRLSNRRLALAGLLKAQGLRKVLE